MAKEIGFPLIIKAAFGGGGRGMRVVTKPGDLADLLDEAQGEAGRVRQSGGVSRTLHPARNTLRCRFSVTSIGNVVHLHERDCPVQRRHQKVIEIAPSVELDEKVRTELCEAAVKLCQEISYDNAGTVEFLYDQDTKEWFFIEMNLRIRVEHTVTEVITGLDLGRSQILIADGKRMHGAEVGIPAQNEIRRNGYAIQCRITTEDPENKFQPDYGRIPDVSLGGRVRRAARRRYWLWRRGHHAVL